LKVIKSVLNFSLGVPACAYIDDLVQEGRLVTCPYCCIGASGGVP